MSKILHDTEKKTKGLTYIFSFVVLIVILLAILYADTHTFAAELLTEKQPVEIAENYEIYDNGNGTKTLRLWQEPIYERSFFTGEFVKIPDKEIIEQPPPIFDNTPSKSVNFKFINTAVAATIASNSATADTYIFNNSPTTNYGTATKVAVYANTTSNYIERSLLRWTLPNISGTITQVTSNLKTSWFGTNRAIEVHDLTQTGWIETQATWNKYITTTNWASAGGDYSATIIDSVAGATLDNWTVHYLQGGTSDNPKTINFGDTLNLLYKLDNEAPGGGDIGIEIYSSNHGTSANRPYLDITYLTPPTITSFTPLTDHLPTHVIVTGTGFTSTGTLSFNGSFITTEFLSSTTVHGDIPEGATEDYVVYTNADGTATSSAQFIPLHTEDLLLEQTNQTKNLIVLLTIIGIIGIFDLMRRTLWKH